VNEETLGGGDPLTLIPEFHRTTRMPLDAVVRLHFEGTVAYQNGFAANVSALGMYVKHPDPPPIGTRLVFEFVLGEERKPVQGAGVVAWLREKYDGPGRPAGVGIRFTELDALSRQHIAESLFEYLEAQLGVDVADHPDVPNLLAAVPKRSAALELDELAAAPAAAEELRTEAGPAAESASPSLTFQLFDEPAPAVTVPDEAIPVELLTPEIPPDDATGSGYARRNARAGRTADRSPWVAIGIALLIAVAGFAGWWYLLGPGSIPDLPLATPPVAAEPTPAPEPERPALDPEPGPEGTLAESIGADTLPQIDPGAPAPEADAALDEARVEPSAPPEAASPAPQPPPATASAPTPKTATRVAEIAWDSSPGSTVVTLIGDGAFAPGGYRFYEMGGERPRVLLRLTGMAAGYPRPTLAVGTPELSGIRIGYHEKPAGNELHIVLDLAAPGVRLDGVALEDGHVVVRLSRSQ